MKGYTFTMKKIEPIKKFKNPSKVVKSLRDECDLNKIYERYCAGDALPVVRDMKYGDMTITVDSYVQAQNVCNAVKEQFETLPSNIRAEFNNNPMDFVSEYNSALNGDTVCAKKLIDLKIIDVSVSDVVPSSGSISSLISGADTKNLGNEPIANNSVGSTESAGENNA